MSLELSSKYKSLYTSNCRYFIITGGRGSAKSFAVNTFLTHLTFQQRHKILFTRYTLTSAGVSIIPEFLEKPELLGLSGHFYDIKNNVLNTTTKVEVLFRGIKTSSGNQTAALKSIQGVSTWVLDEAEELVDESSFDTIDLSVRNPFVQNRVILIMNPTTKEHFIYERFFEDMGVQPGFNGVKDDVCYIHTDYRDNKHLPDSVLRSFQRMKEQRPEKYKNVVLGGWLDRAEGVVFKNWSLGEFDTSLPYIFGQDYGYSNDPTTLIKVAVDKKLKRIYLHECLYKPELTTTEIARINIDYAGKHTIIGDNSEPRLINELRKLGSDVRPSVKGPDSIRIGISRMLDYEIVITPTSNNLIKEFNNYAWNDKKSGVPIDKWNHAIDAVRYALEMLLGKVKQPVKVSYLDI